MKDSLGKHIILEMYGCSFEVLNDGELLIKAFEEAVKEAKMTLLNLASHKFDPYGFTAVALLSESHMSIHTYPELGYAAADVFTCGDEGNPTLAMDVLLSVIKPEKKTIIYVPRGIELPKEYIVPVEK